MNEASNSGWSGAEQFEPLDHDFGNLLELDNIDLDFSSIGGFYHNDLPHHDANQQITAELVQSFDAQHLQNNFSPQVPPGQHDGGSGAQQPQHAMGGSGMAPGANNFLDFDMAQYGQGQVYQPHPGVPPTPNSTEMHADPARYLQQMQAQEAMFDQSFRIRKEDASFTPLVSPAVTPHEGRFQVPVTIIPGAYFSPLTSPALTAQNHQQAQGQQPQYANSTSSTGASPLDIEMGDAAMPPPEHGRRLRNSKRSAPRTTTVSTRVRQSPIVKPNRRKPAASTFRPHNEVTELVDEAQKAVRPPSSGPEMPRTSDSSEFDSVSPENLSEMAPPPRPRSVTQSPAFYGQVPQGQGQGGGPATPASLMRLQQSPSFADLAENMPALDDLTLPEPSLERPPPSRTDIVVRDDEGANSHTSSRKTPKLNPLSTPSAGVAMSGRPSPMLSAVSSPTSPAVLLGAARKLEPKMGRNSKKRNSVSSALVSPAIRPKISPSIKPLVSNGASDDTHTLLLASKSNYQNILEGNTVPGVVYPTSLSTNLTSKRTSHKIAEQGRRNRINTALQEMQALLPSPQLNAKDGSVKSPELPMSAQSNNSKAAKVESAIEYIKQLQKECSEKDRLLRERDEEMGALRKQLAALKSGEAATSPSSAEADSQTKTEKSASPGSENET